MKNRSFSENFRSGRGVGLGVVRFDVNEEFKFL